MPTAHRADRADRDHHAHRATIEDTQTPLDGFFMSAKSNTNEVTTTRNSPRIPGRSARGGRSQTDGQAARPAPAPPDASRALPYHTTPLTTPTHTRAALSYVLNNAKRHSRQLGEWRWRRRSWIDPCSSASYFDGWAAGCEHYLPRKRDGPPPVAAARTRMLIERWRGRGLIDSAEEPGPDAPRRPRHASAVRS